MKAVAALVALVALFLASASALVIDGDIQAAFARNETVDVFVHLPFYKFDAPKIDQVLTRAEMRTQVYNQLNAHNSKYQPKLKVLLKGLGLKYRAFWIVNTILVRDVTESVFQILSRFPNVVELEANKDSAHIIDPMVHSTDDVAPTLADWNVEIVNAPAAWAFTLGKGVTVANIDTGVRYTHEAVRDNYRGNNGGIIDHNYHWHDPRGQAVPFDNNGHGTHTMGTLAGSVASGVGVAPESRWIAAKGCASSSCATADLLSSAEFVLCPTDVAGQNPDCNVGADLVSNSWGGGRGSTTFQSVIEAWVAAEVVPLFSQGNSGSSCSTANSPGDLGIVIGVGSTNRNDALSSFSSRGPGVGSANFPLQKPDISAPGEAVRSAYPTTDTSYATLSGTSMACPAAAGVVALLLSKNPTLTIDQVRQVITKTAKTNLPAPNGGLTTCAGVAYTAVPNYHYGFGRIDALAAINSV